MPKFLMAYPRYFDVSYEINSWMSIKIKPDNLLAISQWRRLNHLLLNLGADVSVLDAHKGSPDLVFCANAGSVLGNVFIPSNFKHKERQDESEIYKKWFVENGFALKEIPSEYSFEGHGDAIFLDDKLIAGHGFRSSVASHSVLSDLLNVEVVPVELVNSYFYHLDTCFFVLNQKSPSIMYFPGAFSEKSLLFIQELPYDKYEVSTQEAEKFACNAVQVNDSVILSEDCPYTAEWLRSKNIKVYFNDISEFKKSGGGNACQVLEI
jgi:N-dimethylarginine dimethylaminohydrolase